MSFDNGGDQSDVRLTMVWWKLLMVVAILASLAAPTGADASQFTPPDCNTWGIGSLPPDNTWVPSTHYVEIGEYDDGSRYILTQMIWDDVSGLGTGSTYESEVVLNNSDASPGTYLDGSENAFGMPIVTRAASNLPAWYLDTRMGDTGARGDRVETAFTIGSGRADDIEANTLYSTLIVAPAGNADVDHGRFTAQLGCQMPPGCASTWCSFSARFVDLVPAWDLAVPGSAGINPLED